MGVAKGTESSKPQTFPSSVWNWHACHEYLRWANDTTIVKKQYAIQQESQYLDKKHP